MDFFQSCQGPQPRCDGPDCSRGMMGPFAWCTSMIRRDSPENSPTAQPCNNRATSQASTVESAGTLLDMWKTFLIRGNSIEDFDLVRCPTCDSLVPSSSVRSLAKPPKKTVSILNSDRDGTASGSSEAPGHFVFKVSRNKKESELNATPLWASEEYESMSYSLTPEKFFSTPTPSEPGDSETTCPASPERDTVLEAIKKAAELAAKFEWMAAEEILLDAYDDTADDEQLRQFLVGHGVFKRVCEGMTEYYENVERMGKAMEQLIGKGGKKSRKQRRREKKEQKKAERAARRASRTSTKGGGVAGALSPFRSKRQESKNTAGSGEKSPGPAKGKSKLSMFSSKGSITGAEDDAAEAGKSLEESGWKCVYESNELGAEARLWILFDKKNLKGYYQAQVVISAELADCIMAYNELELFHTWNSQIVKGPNEFGPRSAARMQAWSVLGIGPKLFQKKFITAYHYQRFLDSHRGWVTEVLASLPDGLQAEGMPKEKIDGALINATVTNMWFPTVDHNGKNATLVTQWGAVNVPFKIPDWLVSMIGNIVAPSFLKEFRNAAKAASTEAPYHKCKAADISGLYKRTEEAMAVGKEKLGIYSNDGQSRLTPSNLPTANVFRRRYDMRRLIDPNAPLIFNWNGESLDADLDDVGTDLDSHAGSTPLTAPNLSGRNLTVDSFQSKSLTHRRGLRSPRRSPVVSKGTIPKPTASRMTSNATKDSIPNSVSFHKSVGEGKE
eukprot:gene722-130_t